MSADGADATASGTSFRVCPRCGRDNRVKMLIDQPCL